MRPNNARVLKSTRLLPPEGLARWEGEGQRELRSAEIERYPFGFGWRRDGLENGSGFLGDGVGMSSSGLGVFGFLEGLWGWRRRRRRSNRSVSLHDWEGLRFQRAHEMVARVCNIYLELYSLMFMVVLRKSEQLEFQLHSFALSPSLAQREKKGKEEAGGQQTRVNINNMGSILGPTTPI